MSIRIYERNHNRKWQKCNRKKVIKDPKTNPIAREIFMMYLQGKSAKKIHEYITESTFEKIMERNLLDGVEVVDVLETHLHSDHAGSLPSLLFACEYGFKIKPTVIYPEKEVMADYLRLTGNEQQEFQIVTPEEYTRYPMTAIPQEHSKFINAYGYLLNINGTRIYYSGDAHTINPAVLQRLNNGQIDYFYQDVTRYENSAHMNIDTLNGIILPQNKDKVRCMHFDDDVTREKAERLGFKCAIVERERDIPQK